MKGMICRPIGTVLVDRSTGQEVAQFAYDERMTLETVIGNVKDKWEKKLCQSCHLHKVVITVTDSSAEAAANATVEVNGQLYDSTNSSGQVTFMLDDGTYSVSVMGVDGLLDPVELVVDGEDENVTVAPPAPDDGEDDT